MISIKFRESSSHFRFDNFYITHSLTPLLAHSWNTMEAFHSGSGGNLPQILTQFKFKFKLWFQLQKLPNSYALVWGRIFSVQMLSNRRRRGTNLSTQHWQTLHWHCIGKHCWLDIGMAPHKFSVNIARTFKDGFVRNVWIRYTQRILIFILWSFEKWNHALQRFSQMSELLKTTVLNRNDTRCCSNYIINWTMGRYLPI